MSAVLRTAWALLSVPAVLAFACFLGLKWLMSPDQEFMQARSVSEIYLRALMSLTFMAALVMLTMRIAKVLEAGVWRLLPGGYRTVVRATGLIMLVLMILPVLFNGSAVTSRLSNVPFGPKLSDLVFFTLLSFLLLAGIGRRQSRLVVAAYLLGCIMALHFMVNGFAQVPAFWFVAGGLCAAAWLFASFGKLPYPGAGSWWRRLLVLPALPKLALARIRFPFVPRSPARELLRSRRGLHSGLPFAALLVACFAGFQHFVLGARSGQGKTFFQYPVVLVVTMFLVVLLSQEVGAAARSLWLRWGDSRKELFGLAERMLFRDAAILCILGWSMVTLFAWRYGPAIDAQGALKMLAAYLFAAFAPIYLALASSTISSWWQRLICAVACFGAVTFLSFRWLDSFGASPKVIKRIDVELLPVLFLILLALRVLASWRWRTIDWTYFRQTRR